MARLGVWDTIEMDPIWNGKIMENHRFHSITWWILVGLPEGSKGWVCLNSETPISHGWSLSYHVLPIIPLNIIELEHVGINSQRSDKPNFHQWCTCTLDGYFVAKLRWKRPSVLASCPVANLQSSVPLLQWNCHETSELLLVWIVSYISNNVSIIKTYPHYIAIIFPHIPTTPP